jgi:hypothetical protein
MRPMKKLAKGENRSESRDPRELFGKTSKKPEADDKPRRVPADRNTGSPLSRKLAGKVIG